MATIKLHGGLDGVFKTREVEEACSWAETGGRRDGGLSTLEWEKNSDYESDVVE